MSAVPTDVRLIDEPRVGERRSLSERWSPRARAYFFTIAAVAGAASFPLLAHVRAGTSGWPTFIAFATTAAVAQLFVVRTPRNQSYHTTIVFLIPAAMLLPPEFIALMGLIQHVPEWLKNRNAWFSQTFNICNYTLAVIAAWGSFHAIHGASSIIPNGDVRFALGGLAAAVALVAVNHTLLAPMLHLGYGHSIRELGIFSFESLSTDLVLAMLGVGIGTFWHSNPWLIPFAVAPLLLIHRSLSVP